MLINVGCECTAGTLAMPLLSNRSDLSNGCAVEAQKPSGGLTLNYLKVHIMSYSKCHPYRVRTSVLSATDLFMPLKKQPGCLLSLAGFLQYISLAHGKPGELEFKHFS